MNGQGNGGPNLAGLPTLYEAWTARKEPHVIPVGFPSLTKLLGGGLRAGQLVVCTASPGSGKTSLALTGIATYCAASGWPVLYVSAELDEDWIAARLASMKLGVPWVDVLDNKIDQEMVLS